MSSVFNEYIDKKSQIIGDNYNVSVFENFAMLIASYCTKRNAS
jgi:hypothetical protein